MLKFIGSEDPVRHLTSHRSTTTQRCRHNLEARRPWHPCCEQAHPEADSKAPYKWNVKIDLFNCHTMSTSISATAAAAAAAAATGISSSSPTSSVLWVSLLPLILITTSSILLDYVLFYETVHDRCRCQVLLWLAVVLTAVGDSNRGSSDDNDTAKNNTVAAFLLWVHATLFFNLLAILWEALQRRGMVFTASSYGQSKQSRDLLRGFPVASWTAMMAASFVVASSSNTAAAAATRSTTRTIAISAQVFAATLLVLWLLGWHIHRHQRIRQELEGMPTTESIHSDPTIAAASIGLSSNRLCGGSTRGGVDCTTGLSPQSRWWQHQLLDESQWFTWNRHETIQWISQQLVPTGGSTATAGTTSSNTVMGARTGSGAAATALTDEAKQERERVLSILIPHGITGDVLDGLTLTSLLSLNVPFGPSCRLASTIAYRLVDRYPKPLSMMPTVLSPAGVAGNAHLETAQRSSSSNKEEVSWLSQHDREYNNGTETEELPTGSVSHQMTRETTVTSLQKDDYTPDGLAGSVSVDPELERMEALMRERFGFELPKLRTVNGTNTDLSSTAETAVGNSTTTLPSHPLANTHGDTIGDRRPPYRDDPPLLANTYPTARPSAVPKALLDQMPSRIQEIAQRRPDLVRELLQQKRHPPAPPQEDRDQQIMERTAATTAGRPPPTTRTSTTPLRRRNQQRSQISETLLGATGLDTTDEWEDDIDGGGGGDDDERTSLIQRDNHHRHDAANSLRYKSINDKMTMTPKSTGVD